MTYMFVQWTFIIETTDFNIHSSHATEVCNQTNYAVSRYRHYTLITASMIQSHIFAVHLNSKM